MKLFDAYLQNDKDKFSKEFIKEKRKLVNLSGENLKEFNFSLLNISYANLQDADLQGTELIFANLEGADLQDTELECAKYNKVTILPFDEEEAKRRSR